jgi:hypothetical protein
MVNHIKSTQKVVVETLLLETPSSSVDVEALELEAEIAMNDSAATMIAYKADLDKLLAPILVNILMGACGNICNVVELQELASALVAKKAKKHKSYSKIFEVLNAVCTEGKKIGWVKFRNELVSEYGLENLKESLI